MDTWWSAPLLVLVLSAVALVVAHRTVRRSAVAIEADRPVLVAVRDELIAFHQDLAAVAARLELRAGGAGLGTPDR